MIRPLGVRIPALVGASLVLVGLGWFGNDLHRRLSEQLADRRVTRAGYRLVSPLLDVELPEGYSVNHEPIPFKYKIKRFVEERLRSGKAKDVSVYYRDLLDGPWFGINEKKKYNPASLMKVPVMIAWLKRAQTDPGALQTTFVFDERTYPGPPQNISVDRSLAAGGRYTAQELLRFMMAYSDNKATWLLYSSLRPDELSDVLDGMDVSNDPDEKANGVSAHGYSGFFRILFNAAYLDKEMSEKALELLALQEFPRGMVAGVPKGITVAAKFGESPSTGPGGDEIQLHEFGIVYHPRGPYILGVMTVGHDWDAQAEILREVSRMIYEEIDTQGAGIAAR